MGLPFTHYAGYQRLFLAFGELSCAPLDWAWVEGGGGWGWCNKRGIEGRDMFAECGNFPHLKGGIRHLNEKWRATIPD